MPPSAHATNPDTPSLPKIIAEYPFTDESADIILRSSDKVDFHSHKYILSLMSPIFRTMFSLPQEKGSESSTTVVELLDESQTLKLLLMLCDPRAAADFPDPTSPTEVTRLLIMADKYDMGDVTRAVGERLCRCKLIEEEPVRIYSVATRFNLNKCARIAARNVLRFPLPKTGYASSPELATATGAAVNNLYIYHRTCVQVVTEALQISEESYSTQLLPLIKGIGGPFIDHASCCTRYLKELLAIAMLNKCDGSVIDTSFAESILKHITQHRPQNPKYYHNTTSDERNTSARIPSFLKKLSQVIDDEISKVQVELA